MALPFIRSTGALAWGTGALNVPLPAGYFVNDILVMVAATAYGETLNAAGWAHAPNSPSASAIGGCQLNVLWRRATGSEGAITGDSGDHQVARIVAVGGCETTGSPWDVTNKGFTGATTAVTIPGATTTVADCLVLVAAAFANDINQDGFVSGWTNADLANIAEIFDNLKDVGNGGGIALITGEKAAAGLVGDTTATKTEAGDYSGWFGALMPGVEGSIEVGDETPIESEEPDTPPVENTDPQFAVDTWQFDTPEPDPADRDPIDYYLAWQMMDNSAEATNKRITAIRVTGKLTNASVTIHAASPGDTINRSQIESGSGSRVQVTFPNSSNVVRHERKKVRVRNLSIWTARIEGSWDGTGIKDRLEELIIEGQPHGVTK